MNKNVLTIAFHYPPSFGSSGVQRTVKFCQYLPRYGWRPLVLTAHPRAHPQTSPVGPADVPPEALVTKAFALDTRRHLAIRGSTLRLLSIPDRWVSWWLGAVPAGLRLVLRHRPRVIWSTYPIATAHLVALTLHRMTSIPWIADFRDPMVDDGYPAPGAIRRAHRWIERQAAQRASRLVFTTSSAAHDYLRRHSAVPAGRCLVIPNGFDEPDFLEIPRSAASPVPASRPLRLVHAGFVYQDDRDPRPLFRALARLQKDGHLEPGTLRVDLRAPGTVEYCEELIQSFGLERTIFVLPPLPYREALRDSAGADALLLLQGASCNHQIPAKAYEYLRLNRPILALTPPDSDTSALLRECHGATIVSLADEDAIHAALPAFLASVRAASHAVARPAIVDRYARDRQARDLADCFEAIAG